MPFPDTPKTLLCRLKRHEMPRTWETAWVDFFDLYHYPARIVVRAAFRRYGWYTATEHDVADVVSYVFESIFRGQEKFDLDPTRGRFRQFLTTLCQRRTIDFIRKHRHRGQHKALDATNPNEPLPDALVVIPTIDIEEQRGFETALLGTLLAELRQQVSPQTYLIFELVKLTGHTPAEVAAQLGVKRAVVDNSIYKALQKLRVLAAEPEFADEFHA